MAGFLCEFGAMRAGQGTTEALALSEGETAETPAKAEHRLRRQYRPDLDGLRALAVLPVLFFHFRLGVPGGFVGVDVFFVISGFFITSLLLDELHEGKFSILKFYERRVRRILPALFALMIVTTIACWFLLLPADLEEYGKSLAATLGFGSNIYFWRDSGYFQTAADLKPLLHTWSLAVEEQFYIFFPPALWLVHRYARKWLLAFLVGGALASLLLSAWAAHAQPVAGFYLSPTRAWELLLGALLAYAPMIVRSRFLIETASVAGFALILGSIMLLNAEMPFPGWLALFPCVGASLIIWASLSGGGIANRLLEWRPVVFIGLISYSLYLWHWPIAAFGHYMNGRDPSPVEAAGMMIAALALATLSWRFVERPFRGRKSRVTGRHLVIGFGGGAIAIAAGAAAIVLASGYPGRFPPEALRYVVKDPVLIPENCFSMTADAVRAGNACRIGDPSARETGFAIWGDSHASRVALPLQQLGAEMRVKGFYFASASCPPLLDVDWPQPGCRAFNDAVFEQIRQNRPRLVVISALWAAYAEGVLFRDSHSPHYVTDSASRERSLADNRRVFAAAVERTVTRLRALGVNVMIVGPVPETGWDVPRGLARAYWFGQENPPVSRAEFEARQATVLTVLRRFEGQTGISVIWPDRALCAATCRVEEADRPLYIDDNHLSLAGTAVLRPDLQRALAALTAGTSPGPARP
jgi:peptidoglycan/LPS O-acetylase OafA/YrhL